MLASAQLSCETSRKGNHQRENDAGSHAKPRCLDGFATPAALIVTAVNAQKKYDPGASDAEIKIGNIML
ncbi:hypothetical protein [Bradyrhizobium sp. URHD0069]|uniref:hypothetical protein n=1 Tax=Bradyrhizobium sp. URHD0069 TaxID=1380355 RepID=UPI000496958D|nr:hypothetical protein [Bradyrhizobium sp. URHD0069]